MKYTYLFIAATITLNVLGCAGAPEPAPQPTEEPQQESQPEPAPEENPAAESRAEATRLRETIERNDFSPSSPETFAAAETAFHAAEEQYQNAPDEALILYNEASTGYRQVIDDGVRLRAERLRGEATAEREQARSVKAHVAQRRKYDQAEEALQQAEAHLSADKYEEAFAAFETAKTGFHDAYIAARAQREEALQALDALDSELTETAAQLEQMQQNVEADDDE